MSDIEHKKTRSKKLTLNQFLRIIEKLMKMYWKHTNSEDFDESFKTWDDIKRVIKKYQEFYQIFENDYPERYKELKDIIKNFNRNKMLYTFKKASKDINKVENKKRNG